LRLENRLERALHHFEAAQRLDPGCARAYAGHGATLALMGQTARAFESYWESLRIQPEQPRIYGALAAMYVDQGRADRAADCLRQAIALAPGDEVLRSNFLYTLNFDSRTSPAELFHEHCEFGRRLEAKASRSGTSQAISAIIRSAISLNRCWRTTVTPSRSRSIPVRPSRIS
jgi:tetratricopeptide (TPR) repeat protein